MLALVKRFSTAYRVNFVLGPLCKLIEVFFDLLTPLIVARMIDEGVGGRDVAEVLRYGGLLMVFALAGISFALVCQKMASRASQGVGTEIRHALYQRINELSALEIDRFGTPSLITRITNDVNQVQLAVALAIRQLIRWPFLAAGSVAAALLIDVRLGLVFLVCAPIIGGLFWLVMARCVPYFKSMQEKLDRIGLITREGLSGARVIRAFVREDHERERFRAAATDQAATAIAVGRLSSVLNPVTFLVMNLAICVILWQGGIEVDAGELTQGQVVAFVNYMTQTLLSIVYVANLVVVFTRASASAARVSEVLAVEPFIASAGGLTSPACSPVALRLDRASFRFPGASADVVADISLELPEGATLGIIGGTGSGKSTLVSLLPRLYDATEGSVEVLGRDVRAWSLNDLRRRIGLVPQRASLVSGTIRGNLTWRDPEASDEELWRALDVAQAGDFVRRLPQGLDAPVEAGGKNYSGGQRQRLTIARALVGSPSLLILDDSSSALDLKTDAALRHAIRGLSTTTVIVSQRVSAVRGADVILVMRRGRAAGIGTHDELMRTCEVYREICASQGIDGANASVSDGVGAALRGAAPSGASAVPGRFASDLAIGGGEA